MILLFAIVAVIGLAGLLGINFYPPLKQRWAKWSVLIEGIVATGIYWLGQVSDALKAAQDAGYLPAQWVGYLPYVFLAYLLVKRLQDAIDTARAAK